MKFGRGEGDSLLLSEEEDSAIFCLRLMRDGFFFRFVFLVLFFFKIDAHFIAISHLVTPVQASSRLHEALSD